MLSLTPLYNLPCASPLFWLMSIARYVFKSPSVCLRGTKYYVYCGRVAYLHSLLWHHAWLWLELFASTVGRFVSQISYLPSYIFLQRRHTFTCTSRKLIHLSREILMYFLQYACLEKFLCFSCTVWSSLCFWSSTYLMISSFWKGGHPRLVYIWIWSMLNMKSAGCEQSLLPLPDFSRKIEGDSALRVVFPCWYPWSKIPSVYWPLDLSTRAFSLWNVKFVHCAKNILTLNWHKFTHYAPHQVKFRIFTHGTHVKQVLFCHLTRWFPHQTVRDPTLISGRSLEYFRVSESTK